MTHLISSGRNIASFDNKFKRLNNDPDLFFRPSWTDARSTLIQIHRGKATGNKRSLKLRCKLQSSLFSLGCFIQRRSDTVLVIGALLLGISCLGLKSISINTDEESLWIEEGGKLEKELNYVRNTLGKGSGIIHQIIIQSAKESGASVLYPESLLHHLEAMQVASHVSVEMFDVQWRLKDLCLVPSFPFAYEFQIEQIFEKMFPCVFITPLDCFWEGSKLLGPEHAVYMPLVNGSHSSLRWTNINPQNLILSLKESYKSFSFEPIEDFFKRAGITSAYQEKPCLNPADPECPPTSPNKNSLRPPDVGIEITGGCYGYATKHMHWPEDLIVGGKVKNRTGHIIRAEAFQTIIELMGEKQLYEHWANDFKVHSVDWSIDKAMAILEAWQSKFLKELEVHLQQYRNGKSFKYSSFASQNLSKILERFSEFFYSGVVLIRRNQPVFSLSGLGMAGVALMAVSVGAGLGLCQFLIKIGMMMSFNASTTQIVPFLSFNLGVDNLFFLVHNYAHIARSNIPYQIGELLKRAGINVLLVSLCSIFAFLISAIIPIRAMRAFALQSTVVMIVNLFSVLVILPAMMCVDLRRRKARRNDVICCLKSKQIANSLREDTHEKKYPLAKSIEQTASLLSFPQQTEKNENMVAFLPISSLKTENVTNADSDRHCQFSLSFDFFAEAYLGPCLLLKSIKVAVMFLFVMMIAGSLWGWTLIKNELQLTDLVPRYANDHYFLEAQLKYFGFYHMYAVTKGDFEYPTNQKLLYEYHESFTRVNRIIKNDNGGLPPFWLTLFRDWLMDLQKSFDYDWKRKHINVDGWHKNASDKSVLAYKLLVQTGHVDNPVDKSLVMHIRLVDSDGIINPKGFYNYLSAWATNDALAYSFSQAEFHPEPKEWFHNAEDIELKIPKSQPLVYAQLPFFLNKLFNTSEVINMIEEVRTICHKFENRGLPNFPLGIPFTYWEQFMNLKYFLILGLGCALSAVFLSIGVVFLNIKAALAVVFVLSVIITELYAIFGFSEIRMSAIPTVILIVSVGISAKFVDFVTAIGSRDRRIVLSLQHVLSPVFHGTASSFLGIVVLLFSEYDFIVRYFFFVLSSLLILGLLNAVIFLPVLLSIIGPNAEVTPSDNEYYLEAPTPQSSPKTKERTRTGNGDKNVPILASSYYKKNPRRMNSDISLSTITEESNSWNSNSHEIVVQPELVVETTTCPPTCSSNSSNSSISSNSGTSHVTTKVTATTKVKVEVHSSRTGICTKEVSKSRKEVPTMESTSVK